MEKIDKLDRQILNIISKNARIPFKDAVVQDDKLYFPEKPFEGLAVCICDYYKLSLQVVKFCSSLLCILKQYIGAFQALLNNCFRFHMITN